jgi:solute carrier family 25 iron transporter 28/37
MVESAAAVAVAEIPERILHRPQGGAAAEFALERHCHQQKEKRGGEEAEAEEEEEEKGWSSFSNYMVAGSVAGMVEHMAMFPVDTLKTRMQMMAGNAAGSSTTSVSSTLAWIVRTEGPIGLYRGIGAMGLGAGPAHAVYFAVYEICKEKLGGSIAEGYHPLAHGAAGVIATMSSDIVLTPMDVVKQRLQLSGNHYRGIVDCIARVFREEGLRAFYASYRTTVVMNAPFTAAHFSTYEAAKKGLKNVWPENIGEDESLLVHLTAGAAAGALASAVTTPMDVVKTRLQCQVYIFIYPSPLTFAYRFLYALFPSLSHAFLIVELAIFTSYNMMLHMLSPCRWAHSD